LLDEGAAQFVKSWIDLMGVLVSYANILGKAA